MADDDFGIDPDELDAVIADIAKTETALETLTDDLHQQILTLHESWEGLAAQAQREAQEEWEKGLLTMRSALAELRAAAEAASSNYTEAADTNRSMWEELG
jgi:WXG100 family type VII secretion target